MKKMLNGEIYNYALELNKEFSDCNIMLPVKINFFLQKNIHLIVNLAEEIEEAKNSIIKAYGEKNADTGSYIVKTENIQIAKKELDDLTSIEQEVNIHMFKLDDFDKISLTYNQMNAIMFMIEE